MNIFLLTTPVFSLPEVQSIMKQMIHSIAFVHDMGIIHNNLNLESILLKNSKSIIVQENGCACSKQKILADSSLTLIDFDQAVFENEERPQGASSIFNKSPEDIFGTGWSYPDDMWSIGCIMYELMTSEYPFDIHKGKDALHLAMM